MSNKRNAFMRSLLIGVLSIIPISGLAIASGINHDGSSNGKPGVTQETRQDIREGTNPGMQRSGVGLDVAVPGAEATVDGEVVEPGVGVSGPGIDVGVGATSSGLVDVDVMTADTEQTIGPSSAGTAVDEKSTDVSSNIGSGSSNKSVPLMPSPSDSSKMVDSNAPTKGVAPSTPVMGGQKPSVTTPLGSDASKKGASADVKSDDGTCTDMSNMGVVMDKTSDTDNQMGMDVPDSDVSVEMEDSESGSYWTQEESVDSSWNGSATTEQIDIQQTRGGARVYYGTPYRYYYGGPRYGYYSYHGNRPYNYYYRGAGPGYYPYYDYYMYYNYNRGW